MHPKSGHEHWVARTTRPLCGPMADVSIALHRGDMPAAVRYLYKLAAAAELLAACLQAEMGERPVVGANSRECH